MSACLPGREVVIQLRRRTTGTVKMCSVVCPANWERGRLLNYVRREHPNEAVVIKDWKPVATEEDRWHTRLWIVNPTEMTNR
jgi:hypothetical protein